VDLARDHRPLLFLLDEILHGTNSEDRRVRAQAVVHGLLGRGAVGLATTHDLALARIADDPALQGQNVHFDHHLEGGHLAFDQELKKGAVGLEVRRRVV
jgi:DNA mismatch repair ATPase MutS